MTRGPARAGGVLYAKDPLRVAQFYCRVLGMVVQHQDGIHAVIRNDDMQLVIHGLPPDIDAQVVIDSPPQLRTQSALKLFFTVPSLEAAAAAARPLGGDVQGYRWTGPGFRARDGHDCEGNLFQLREPLQQI